MTIKASGTLAISEILAEAGAGRPNGLGWLKSITKPSQRLPDGSVPMSLFYDKAYYQSYMNGQCDNGNCGGRHTGPVDCANCDTQKWLQPNCNSPSPPRYQCTACACNSSDWNALPQIRTC